MEQATGARRAAVAMSGGVDSSVAALLLAQAGWACTGVTLRLYAGADAAPDGARTCCSLEDVEDARAVARRLGIRHYTFNFTEAFERDVIGRFVQGYLAGETPNPCIDCNKHIKFSALLRRAQLMGCTHVATGHYARIVRGANGRMLLQTGLDAGKDQSYFLYMLKEWQLSRALFPLGGMTKAQVRAVAEENGLCTSKKKDSTGVCFIGERNFRRFLQGFLPLQPGEMRTPDGRVVGEHIGLAYYTLGQRRGLGIGGGGDGRRWFVVDKDLANNVLIVEQGEDSPRLYSRFVRASGATWIAGDPPAPDGTPMRLTARFRYRQSDQAVTVVARGESLLIAADELQRAVTPGQSVVLYDGDVCLGGAVADAAGMTAKG